VVGYVLGQLKFTNAINLKTKQIPNSSCEIFGGKPPVPPNTNYCCCWNESLAMPSSYLYKVASLKAEFEQQTDRHAEDIFPQVTGSFCEYFISHECVCIALPASVPRESFDHRWFVSVGISVLISLLFCGFNFCLSYLSNTQVCNGSTLRHGSTFFGEA
jgi:hypothetical protein